VSFYWIFVPQHNYTNVFGQKALLNKTLEKTAKCFSDLKNNHAGETVLTINE